MTEEDLVRLIKDINTALESVSSTGAKTIQLRKEQSQLVSLANLIKQEEVLTQIENLLDFSIKYIEEVKDNE